MAENEIKESRNEVSRIVKKPVENIYGLSSLYRVFWARVIDIVVIAIPVLISELLWQYLAPISEGTIIGRTFCAFGIELISIFIFLCVIPKWCNGASIGKGLTGIRLRRAKGDKKLKLYMLVVREFYFLVVPLLLALIMNCIAFGILMSGSHEGSGNATAEEIQKLSYLVYFLWFVFLLVTIKAQSEHQAGVDMHWGLFVVYKEPIRQITKDVEVKETSIILTDEPGNLSKENIDELVNNEARQFDKSISLEDLDLKIDRDALDSKKNKEETKKIEHDDKKKDKGKKK